MTHAMGPIEGWTWTILICLVMLAIPARAYQRLFMTLLFLALFPVGLLVFFL